MLHVSSSCINMCFTQVGESWLSGIYSSLWKRLRVKCDTNSVKCSDFFHVHLLYEISKIIQFPYILCTLRKFYFHRLANVSVKIYLLLIRYIVIILFVCLIRVWSITSLCFDIDIPYSAHKCITIKRCHDSSTCMTFTFDVMVRFKGFLNKASCATRNFCLLWHLHILFGKRVYHHKTMCRAYPWSRLNVNNYKKLKIFQQTLNQNVTLRHM